MKISQLILLFLSCFSIMYCDFVAAAQEASIRIDGNKNWIIDDPASEKYLYIAKTYRKKNHLKFQVLTLVLMGLLMAFLKKVLF